MTSRNSLSRDVSSELRSNLLRCRHDAGRAKALVYVGLSIDIIRTKTWEFGVREQNLHHTVSSTIRDTCAK